LTRLLLSSRIINDDDFEWDDAKNAADYAKHGVWFERARLVFADAFAVGAYDDREDYGEDRFTIAGMVEGTLLFVACAEHGDRVRIITARRATKHEQDDYFQQNSQGP
jgi:hypothetical protein